MDGISPLAHNLSMVEERITYLRKWREKRGMTQEGLGGKVGMTQGMISQLEDGKTNFTGKHLAILSKVLRCSVFELLFVDPDADPDNPLAQFLKMKPAEQQQAVRLALAAKSPTSQR